MLVLLVLNCFQECNRFLWNGICKLINDNTNIVALTLYSFQTRLNWKKKIEKSLYAVLLCVLCDSCDYPFSIL